MISIVIYVMVLSLFFQNYTFLEVVDQLHWLPKRALVELNLLK